MRVAFLSLFLLAAPIAVQAQTPAAPVAAEQPVDPALLAKAQPIAALILPDGTMEKMMGPMMHPNIPAQRVCYYVTLLRTCTHQGYFFK